MNDSFLPNPSRDKTLYHAYLLRLWCTKQADMTCWRASLEDSHTGERIGFAGLEQLFAFLIEQTEPGSIICPLFRPNDEVPK